MSDDDLPERQLFLIVSKHCRDAFENKNLFGDSEHRDLQEAMLLMVSI